MIKEYTAQEYADKLGKSVADARAILNAKVLAKQAKVKKTKTAAKTWLNETVYRISYVVYVE